MKYATCLDAARVVAITPQAQARRIPKGDDKTQGSISSIYQSVRKSPTVPHLVISSLFICPSQMARLPGGKVKFATTTRVARKFFVCLAVSAVSLLRPCGSHVAGNPFHLSRFSHPPISHLRRWIQEDSSRSHFGPSHAITTPFPYVFCTNTNTNVDSQRPWQASWKIPVIGYQSFGFRN